MTKSLIDRILALETDKEPPLEAPQKSDEQMPLPTMDERVKFYLRAVNGPRDFGNQEYSDARNLLLKRMAEEIADKSLSFAAQNVRFAPASKTTPSSPEVWAAASLELSLKEPSHTKTSSLFAPLSRLSPPHEFAEELPCRLSEPRLSHDLAPALDDVALAQSRTRFPAPAYKRARRSVFIWAAGATVAAFVILIAVVRPMSWLESSSPTSLERHTGVQSPSDSPTELRSMPSGNKTVETTAAPVGAFRSVSEGLPSTQGVVGIEQTPDSLRIGHALVVAGDIANARLILKRAAEAGNAPAALELGGTYDPMILNELKMRRLDRESSAELQAKNIAKSARKTEPESTLASDISLAKFWYERARDLGSVEASRRLETLLGASR
jgi:hypothetical protein